MNACLFAFCAGVIILYCSAVLLPWWVFIAAFVVIFFCFPERTVLPSLLLLLGWAYANSVATSHYSNIIPSEFEGVLVTATGERCSLISSNERSQSFRFCASAIQMESAEPLAGKRLLQINVPYSITIPAVPATLRLQLKLKVPRGSVNPVGLSFEQYYFQQKVVGVGRALEVVEVNHQSQLFDYGLQAYVLSWRERLAQKLQLGAGEFESYGIIRALVIGDRRSISDGWEKALSATGTQHLMAISGLHVGMIALLLWRFLPKSRTGLFFFAALTFVYVVIVGFSESAQRAWLMSVFLAFAGAGYIKLDWKSAWLGALALVLLLNPLSVLSVGFIYSFTSVALLILLAQAGWISINTPVRSFLIVQLFFLLMLGVLNAIMGVAHNGVFLLANLVAVPWVSWVVLPVSLFAFSLSWVDVPCASALYSFINQVLQFLYAFLESLSALPIALNQDRSFLRLVAFSVVLFAVVVSGRFSLLSAAGLVLLVAALAIRSSARVETPELTVFDTGQGLSVLIRSEYSVWLYDLGPSYGSSSAARRIVLPYLRAVSGVDSMDGLVISHGDNDHAGDYVYFLSQVDPKLRWSGEVERLHWPSEHPYQSDQFGFVSCKRGMRWERGELLIEVLYPARTPKSASSNNHSCVLRVTLSDKVFLLMGDLESDAEMSLVRDMKADLKADVLIAGHHGSKKATSYALLKHVQPDNVVVSAGYRNRFGHPHVDVISRVKAFDAAIFNTASDGAVRFVVGDGGIKIERARTLREAFWLVP